MLRGRSKGRTPLSAAMAEATAAALPGEKTRAMLQQEAGTSPCCNGSGSSSRPALGVHGHAGVQRGPGTSMCCSGSGSRGRPAPGPKGCAMPQQRAGTSPAAVAQAAEAALSLGR